MEELTATQGGKHSAIRRASRNNSISFQTFIKPDVYGLETCTSVASSCSKTVTKTITKIKASLALLSSEQTYDEQTNTSMTCTKDKLEVYGRITH